jgi:ATP synthase I chain
MRIEGERVAGRLYKLMGALTASGIIASWVWFGSAGALGFAVGAAISFANAYWMHRLVRAIGDPARKPSKPSIVFALLRYIIMLVSLYAIFRVSETGFLTALAGCFVHIAAVVLEVVYEITYGTS